MIRSPRAPRPPGGLGALIGVVLAALLVAFAGPAPAAPKFPALTGRVVDEAHLLSDRTRTDLTDKLAALEARTRRQLVVVTLASLQGYDIADYGYQLGRAWGIGQKGDPGAAPGTEKDNGVLFIVAPSDRSVRIEVGYGLEGVLTDALSSVILQTKVLPRFREGDMEGGVVAGTDALIEQLGLPPDQAAAAVRQASQQQQRERPGLGELLPLLFILFVLIAVFRGGRGGWLAPLIFGGLASRGRRGWDDDDWRGGGFGGGFGSGGGFSGGGGSFGGGGASGRW